MGTRRAKDELPFNQAYALWLIWRVEGVSSSYPEATLPGGKPHRIHAGTIVALVGRGLLYGGDGIIRVTEAGHKLALTI